MDDLPSIILWSSAPSRPSSPPPSPNQSTKYDMPSTPVLTQGPQWTSHYSLAAQHRSYRMPDDLLTPPASPVENLKPKAVVHPVRPAFRAALSDSTQTTTEEPSNVTTDSYDAHRRRGPSREEDSKTLHRSLLDSWTRTKWRMLSSHESSAVTEKRRLLTGSQHSRSPFSFRWRYKKVIRKRLFLLTILCVIVYHCYYSISSSFGINESLLYDTPEVNDLDSYPVIRDSPSPRVKDEVENLNTRIAPGTPHNPAPRSYQAHAVRNGILHVDTSLAASAHPVLQLIKESRSVWQNKMDKQSKTLKQAVVEYKKRNRGQAPPKGFDKWWKLVKENNIALPDEYDQINKDLELFRALSPRELNSRLDRALFYPDTFRLAILDGEVSVGGTFSEDQIEGASDRMSGQVALLEEFNITSWIPNLRAVFGVHDTPLGFIASDHRSDLLTAVEDGEYYDPTEELDETVRGWAAACPPKSPLRLAERGLYRPRPPGKSFVADISANVDLCQHPEIIGMHGITAGKSPNVAGRLEPMFSLSKTSLHTDVLAVPVEQWVESLPAKAWEERTSSKLLWRGSNTGIYHATNTPWRESHRSRLVRNTNKYLDGDMDILSPAYEGDKKSKETLDSSMLRVNRGMTNAKLFDVAFVGKPIQCDVDDGTCRDLAEEYDFKKDMMTFEEALEYKYVLDVDGNSWSARTQRLLMSGSLLFKSSINPEWWTDRIQPWVHYVPLRIDYSDLHDAFVFFHGDAKGQGGRDDLAQEIAQAGQEWAAAHWRRVDMAAYMARLYLEWARLVAPLRSKMDFVYDESMEI